MACVYDVPVTVGDQTRRAELLDALLRITATRGLDAVSVREVAAEAGVSPATVQYYFRTKEELLLAASEQVERRLTARLEAIPPGLGVRQYLRAAALAWLPCDADRAATVRTWAAFVARALVTDRLAAIEAETTDWAEERMAELITQGKAGGEFAPDVDPVAEAGLLLALIDGLSLRMLTDPAGMPVGRAVAVLDAHLAQRPAAARG